MIGVADGFRATAWGWQGTRTESAERLEAVSREYGEVPAVKMLVDFIQASGNRALCLPRQPEIGTDDDYDDEDV